MLTPLEKYFKEYAMCFDGVRPQGEGTKSKAITISLFPQCGGYNRALRHEKLLCLLFPVGGGGGYK